MDVNDVSRGMTIDYEGELYSVVESTHMVRGRGRAIAQIKLKHLLTGKVISRRLTDADEVERAHLEERPLRYLYRAQGRYHLMDIESYEQFSLAEEQLGDLKRYLVENMDITGFFYRGALIKVQPPTFVDLQVVETEPGVRGDTATGGEKPAVLETGLQLKVPLFIEPGERVRVDTRDGSYLERVRE